MCEKGKQAELRFVATIAKLGENNKQLDITRYSKTYQADNGNDLTIHHTEKNLQELTEIAQGKRTTISTGIDDETPVISTRVDVKNYSGAIDKATIEKFGNDIIKNSGYKGQMLVGGNRLTAGAKKALERLQECYGDDKTIIYLNNTEVERLHMVAKALDKKTDDSKE